MSINAAVLCRHKLNSVEKEKYVPFVFYLIVWKKKNYFLFSSYVATLYSKICNFFVSLFSCFVVKPQVPIEVLFKIDETDYGH